MSAETPTGTTRAAPPATGNAGGGATGRATRRLLRLAVASFGSYLAFTLYFFARFHQFADRHNSQQAFPNSLLRQFQSSNAALAESLQQYKGTLNSVLYFPFALMSFSS